MLRTYTASLLLAFALFASSTTHAQEATTTPETATSTPEIVVIAPDTITLTIRDGATTVFAGTLELPATTTPEVLIVPTSGDSVAVDARSLLAVLTALDVSNNDFAISDLSYFPSFSSFLINCISVPTVSASPDCYAWTYAVNSSFPQYGIDDYVLQHGDRAFLFFGPQRKVSLSTTTATVGESFTATAQNYDLDSGVYVGAAGLTLGVGTPNPDYTFTEVATGTSDTAGSALFTVHATGTFQVGIAEDYYFPTTPITISDATLPPAAVTPTTNGGSSSAPQFNLPQALSYLASKQNTNGSFGNDALTDWAALAFAVSDVGDAKAKLRDYLATTAPAVSSVTDYERHAMALMALGIDPYVGTSKNYIDAITASFDGTQMGDSHLDNDDIFALFPLLNAGYTPQDEIIQKTVAFILTAQNETGAWDGSVDMTAAAIQALSLVTSLPGVPSSLQKAKQFLKNSQQSNGGWDNSFSTSWAIQAITALGESQNTWAPSGVTPSEYLATLQHSDGGVDPVTAPDNSRIWATEYAIPAVSGKTWDMLLSNFAKPQSAGSSATPTLVAATTSAATGTPPTLATSTAPVATTTPEVLGAATSTLSSIAAPIASTTQTTQPVKKIVAPKKQVVTLAKKTPEIQIIDPEQKVSAVVLTPQLDPQQTFFAKVWNTLTAFLGKIF